MKTRNSALYALGLAAAISFASAVSADAQTRRPTTTRRARPTTSIPVRKDVPVVAKPDTVIVTRVDTVIVRRTDTVTTTMMRTDTVTRMVYPPIAPLPGVFFGLAGGVAIPMNNYRNIAKDGPAAKVEVGYFPENGAFGIRADAQYARLGRRETDCPKCSAANMLAGGADVIFRAPLDRSSKINPVLYAHAGGGYGTFSGVIPASAGNAGNKDYRNTDGKNVDVSGGAAYYSFGPGVAMTIGGMKLFAEGKYTTFMTNGGNTHVFPVYFGLNWY